jgi:hypothetical protein
MINTLARNGTGARAFPREPLLLAPVDLPFKGDYEGICLYYNVGAVRALVDDGLTAYRETLTAFNAQEQAIRASADLSEAEQDRQVDALLLEWAHGIIAQTVVGLDWPWAEDGKPDPAHPETFDIWDSQVVLWVAREGLMRAGAEWSGPLAVRAMRMLPSRS